MLIVNNNSAVFDACLKSSTRSVGQQLLMATKMQKNTPWYSNALQYAT